MTWNALLHRVCPVTNDPPWRPALVGTVVGATVRPCLCSVAAYRTD
jgi:hypothetical protein